MSQGRRTKSQGPGYSGLLSVSPKIGDFVSVTYWDHVQFYNADPLAVSPQRRRRFGRLVYESSKELHLQYIIVVSDETNEPPTLKGGDPKSSGLVILRNDILELKKVG